MPLLDLISRCTICITRAFEILRFLRQTFTRCLLWPISTGKITSPIPLRLWELSQLLVCNKPRQMRTRLSRLRSWWTRWRGLPPLIRLVKGLRLKHPTLRTRDLTFQLALCLLKWTLNLPNSILKAPRMWARRLSRVLATKRTPKSCQTGCLCSRFLLKTR